ncbi:ATP-binding protein [Actinomadura rupiterrae]|uniref:ATP-binding protein n=1 Tax=Actinomadura rupiterrae TaxID=559627 RepID=UPI0020A246C9|nr:ATP-binding protein [Actinomadura rupiterrae]MCP2340272.1 anti-sigma regulatory factor (Ser/Thr protein kinase) [Actinomadura rupiterrae]
MLSKASVGGDQERLVVCRLGTGLGAAGEARRRVAAVFRRWGRADLEDDATLCVSELVTNALNCGASDIRLLIERHTAQMVEVAVWDDGPGCPEVQNPDDSCETGRGLGIVEALSVSWGKHGSADGGKTVWARFVAPDADA